MTNKTHNRFITVRNSGDWVDRLDLLYENLSSMKSDVASYALKKLMRVTRNDPETHHRNQQQSIQNSLLKGENKMTTRINLSISSIECTYSVTACTNGYMIEINGKDLLGEWRSAKYLTSNLDGLFDLIRAVDARLDLIR